MANLKDNQELVGCSKCGNGEIVVKGHLTEAGKKDFLCAGCHATQQMPMESRIAEHAHAGKKLLTEDL